MEDKSDATRVSLSRRRGPRGRGAGAAGRADSNAYAIHKLVSDLSNAAVSDPVLQNAWGVAFSPAGSPFWISDNATGCSTLYDGDGTIVPLQVKLPLPGGVIPPTACMHNDPNNPSNPTPAAPTGMIWNPSSKILVPKTSIPAAFIWATEDGTLSAWAGGLNPATNAVLAADNSAVGPGAVYKGLAYGVNVNGFFLYATNFRAGTIDVFDTSFNSASTAGGFQDPNIPPRYAPFGIQNIDGNLWVTYALQNAQKHDDVPGKGHGFVDVFDTDGNLVQSFAQKGTLNSPWGVARASQAFGAFSGAILIGNFGDGRINAFDPQGNFLGQLKNKKGKELTISGLWTLTLGGGAKSNPDTLYFTAGPNGEVDGLFGTIAPLD
jgi:uncharacterized protein (TIGR03118 family)